MKVLIRIINRKITNIVADDESLVMSVDNKQSSFDAREFVAKMTIITSTWDTRYDNPHILDGEEYLIKFITSDGERILSGKNEFPENYDEFKELISEVTKLWN